MKFIELELYNGGNIVVDYEQISRYCDWDLIDGAKSKVVFKDGDIVFVKEPCKQISCLIMQNLE